MMSVSFSASAQYLRGDVDEDGNVRIEDVTTLIDYLLTGVWPGEEDTPQTKIITVNGVSFTMVEVKGGTFMMGATDEQGADADEYEYPVHQVTLSSYYIAQTEVTRDLWQAVMGDSYSGDMTCPVTLVSWRECQEFITALNVMTGLNFRMPTEAEWEFAARGGNKSKGYKYSGSNRITDVAWYNGNNSGSVHPVATKGPNELGLYDMSGNVREWCADISGDYSDEAQVDPLGPDEGGYWRILRGGAFNEGAKKCRVSYRTDFDSGNINGNIGMRLAL